MEDRDVKNVMARSGKRRERSGMAQASMQASGDGGEMLEPQRASVLTCLDFLVTVLIVKARANFCLVGRAVECTFLLHGNVSV